MLLSSDHAQGPVDAQEPEGCGEHLLEGVLGVGGADVAGALAQLHVPALPKVRQQQRPPALHLLLAVRYLRLNKRAQEKRTCCVAGCPDLSLTASYLTCLTAQPCVLQCRVATDGSGKEAV